MHRENMQTIFLLWGDSANHHSTMQPREEINEAKAFGVNIIYG